MINFTAVANQFYRVMPPRQTMVEALGFSLFGLGVFLGLSIFSFSPLDYTKSGNVISDLNAIQNYGGVYGAMVSSMLLNLHGIVAWLVALAFMVWGGVVALGFLLAPALHRVVGFVYTLCFLSVLSAIQFTHMDLAAPVFGFGGVIGEAVRAALMAKFSYLGSLTVLASLWVIGLVFSGNLTVSGTAHFIFNFRRKLISRAKGLVDHVISHKKAEKAAVEAAVLMAKKSRSNLKSGKKVSKADQVTELTEYIKQDFDVALSSTKRVQEEAKSENVGSSSDGETSLELSYSKSHKKPVPTIFSKSKESKVSEAEKKKLWKIADNLVQQLEIYKISGKVTGIKTGPVVTTFEFDPAPGTKSSKILALSEDLARLLQSKSLRILAPIPGKDKVGFEIPNQDRENIGFGTLIDTPVYKGRKMALPIAMGVDTFGKPVVEDLAKMPHLLVAGSTGSGKSVFMNTLIASLVTKHSAKDLRLIMIDPKMVEMAAYNPLPHMACEVITDPVNGAKKVLDELVVEMDERYQKMKAVGAKNIVSFNEIISKRKKSEFKDFDYKWEKFSYVVMIIDELADMMMSLGKEAEAPITRLAQKARAAGIHLVIATQRPSAEVVTGLIKANFPTRVAFRVLSGIDSRTILDSAGAETLLGMGDMLFLGASGMSRLHGAYLPDDEVEKMVRACK